MRLEGKVTIVTAAAGAGIGKATAWRLAQEGATVIVTDAHKNRAMETAKQLAEEFGRPMPGYELDVRDEARVQQVIHEAEEQFGHVDVLVNNAGINKLMPVWELDNETWRFVLDTCLTGTYLTMKAVLPAMLERRQGVIVNIASMAGFVGTKNGEAAYSAAKAGVMGLTRSVALEVAEYGVRVNAVAPGVIYNEFLSRVYPEGYFERLKGQIPLLRLGEPIDIAEAVVYLATDASKYTTGEVLTITGGRYMHA